MFNHLKSYPEKKQIPFGNRTWLAGKSPKLEKSSINIYNLVISIYKWLSIAIVDSSLMFMVHFWWFSMHTIPYIIKELII